MSQFYKALQRAEQDRALRRTQGPAEPPPSAGQPLPQEHPPSPPESPRPAPRNPSLTVTDLEGADSHLVSLLTPATFEAEQYRVLRHIVEQRRQEAGTQVIGVVSPGVGDGKTVTAINLAGALAQASEVRVLLIDADLRQPDVAGYLGLPVQGVPGVVDLVLNPDLPFEANVIRLHQYNLAVLPAGNPPSVSYELLRSPRLDWLFQEARPRFDYVVVDTPPVIPLPDCRLLQKWVDGFVLVVRAHHTPRKAVQESLEVLDASRILGLVFNANERAGARYTRYYPAVTEDGDQSKQGTLDDAVRRRLVRLGG